MKSTILIIIFLLLGIGTGLFVLPYFPKQYSLLSPLSIVNNTTSRAVKIIGFVPFWLIEKQQNNYQKYLTELSYFSLPIDGTGKIRKFANAQEEEPGWTAINRNSILVNRLKQAKANNMNLSLVVFSGEIKSINQMIESPEQSAANLIEDITPIMKEYGFSDLNLDFETSQNTPPNKRDLYTRFVRTVKELMIKNNLGTVTVDIQGISLFQTYLTDPATIGQIADYIILMTYDYHYPGSTLAGAVAPIGGAGEERVFDVNLTLKAAIEQIPKEKIILGIPLYGYEWNTIASYPGAPAIPGTGALASDKRVSELLKTCQTCTKGIDTVAGESYVIFSEQSHYHQIFYADKKAIAQKIELATKSSIAGIAFWALGYEINDDLEPLTNYKNISIPVN